MIADIGYASILIALLAAVFAAGGSVYGLRSGDHAWVVSARNALIATFLMTTIACGLLVYALWTDDFSIAYVASVTSIETPKYLKVTALWGSQAGSLLFWNWLLCGFTAAAMRRKWHTDRALMPWAIFTASLSVIFFLFITVVVENPFARLPFVPADGQGLNPLLRHPGMIIHPPMLYLGFVGFMIPYAFAMAALLSGKLDDAWIRTTRRWTLVAWLFLSAGLILGGRWAYDVLGWGGYWAWDPVENASFMPWLAGTAFLHSVMIQEKRGMFKMWNMFLIILTYLLVISGTFIVRSGLISSVHTFAQSSIGWYFFVFIAIMILFSAFTLSWRQEALRSTNRLESLLSREAAFLLNNFIILAILAATLLGVYFPVLSELVGDKITVGAGYYEKVNGPLFAVLLLLMGIAPMTMWHRSSEKKLLDAIKIPAVVALLPMIVIGVIGRPHPWALFGIWVSAFSLIMTLLEFHKGAAARAKRGENYFVAMAQLVKRNRRRYGGYMIHMGVIVMAFGIIGIEFFQQETQLRLRVGETTTLGRYTLQFQGAAPDPGREIDDLKVTTGVVDVLIDDRFVTTLRPRREFYERMGQNMTIPAARSTPFEDLYVLMVAWEGIESDAVTLRIYLNPLINWVWFGGVIFVVGTGIAGWPERTKPKRKS